jgi:hypothetical protein
VDEALSVKTVEVRLLEKVLGNVQAFWLVSGRGEGVNMTEGWPKTG